METIYKCNECGSYFKEEDLDTKEICLEEELGVAGDVKGRTYRDVDCCPKCKSNDFDDFRDVDDVDEVIEALNNYNANDHKNAVRYEELMKMPLAIIGGKGVWRNFKEEAKNDKITRYNIADEILQLVIETGGNIHDIVKTINEKYQLDLNEDKYYKE
jgi:hypothetical protein